MSKQTPEPWIYKATAWGHDFVIYSEATGVDVAIVRNFEANAKLLTAAPELLKACELALTLLGTDEEAKNGCPSPEELASDLRAAIDKAEGRA